MTAGRFAVVLGPAAALADDLPPFSAAARARADLLKGDMVEAIIRLPGGLVPFRPGYETALWVLTQARHSRWRGRVLLADVSDRPLTADVVRDLAEDVITWRRDGYVPVGAPPGVRRPGGDQQPGRPAEAAHGRVGVLAASGSRRRTPTSASR